ncbi:MAG: adenosylmethionine--8-amino-7-oxononanoate transaminase [Bacteroidota bacterium]
MSDFKAMNENIWYPFTVLKDMPVPHKVTRGEGVWLELDDGRKIIDGVSSWWTNIYGHAHPKVAEAVAEQAQTLEHVMFANITHEPAEQLATQLADILPGSLNRVFFSDDGSTAVEVALKMAYQYWLNQGEKNRKKFIAFEGAYHGDTFGAMSTGGPSVFNEVFKPLLFDVDFVPFPTTWDGAEGVGDKEDKVIDQIEQMLTDHPDEYAGIIMEPLVQGAGGMRMCRPEFMQKIHWVNRQFGTLLIFDEVMTGFGRTGEWFASQRAQVEPDIICLAKGLTAGFVPLSVTVASDEIYDAFVTDDPHKTLWHGHSFTGNPIGCAAALATIELMDEYESAMKGMEEWHREEMKRFEDRPNVGKIRITGTIAAFDIQNDQEDGYLNNVASQIKKRCVDHGVLLRPLGNVLYLMPPYCITRQELTQAYDAIEALLEDLQS